MSATPTLPFKNTPGGLLRHWYYLLYATIWLTLAFARAGWYFKRRALRDLALPHPESLSSREKRRWQHYFYGTTYLSVIFNALRGQTRTRREKHLFSNLAALAYFFDDLVDAFRDRDDTGVIWEDNPEIYGSAADERGLALHFLHNIYRELPPADLLQFKEFMHRVFNIEAAAHRKVSVAEELQHSAQYATIDHLLRHTAIKGGYSVLLFRRVLAHPLSATEQDALYQFGFLIQLCDDIFDIWHDRQACITTVATALTEKNEVALLQQLFEDQVVIVKQAFHHIQPDAAANRGPYGLAVIHFIISITRVCLQHYADLLKKHGTLPLDNRHVLVMDMERWKNRTRAAYYLLTWR